MSESDKKAEPSWWVTKLAIPIGLAFLSAFVGVTVTLSLAHYSSRHRELMYSVSSNSGLLRRPEIPGKTVKVLIDDKPVDNISMVTITFFNTTDQDYTNLKYDVVFEEKGDNTVKEFVPPDVRSNIYGLAPSPGTHEADLSVSSHRALRYSYVLPVANRRKDELFKVTYMFEGAEAPVPKLVIPQLGVEPKLLRGFGDSDDSGVWPLLLLSLAVLGLALFGLVVIILRVVLIGMMGIDSTWIPIFRHVFSQGRRDTNAPLLDEARRNVSSQ
jgi:hypothetical protein